jgi:tripartite-type tricarboxylate transporter receptor subunit TctC
MMSRFFARLALLALCLVAIHSNSPAYAQYPARNVTIVLPLGPGSGMDVLARVYGDKLSAVLGKPIIVENRPGAATMLAAQTVATAPPDGHTLVVLTSSALSINQRLYKQMSYSPDNDFIPICLYVKSPLILVVNPTNVPVKDVPEFIAYAKKASTPLKYASVGAGAFQHISMEFAKQRFGFDAQHVPYRQTGQSITDLVGGHVDTGFVEAGASIPVIKEDKLRALAVSSTTPLPLLPEVPPFSTASGAADFEAVSWHALLAPAKTPRDIVDKLHAEMKKIMNDAEMKKRAADIGLIPVDTPSIDGINDYIKAERVKWGALVKKIGLEGTQ